MYSTEVIVAYGKPILKLSFRTIRYIAIFLSAYVLFIICYVFILFGVAIQVKSHVGDFVNMVDTDGYVLPTGVAMPALLCLFLCLMALWFIFKACKADYVKRIAFNHLFFIFIMVCVATVLLTFIVSIFLLSHSYSSHESLHDGIKEAMNKYSLDSIFKKHMDLLQVEFQCCGSKKYTEWFNITWFDTNLIKDSEKVSGGETPFSCCSLESTDPCIHHGIDEDGLGYNYSPESNLSISRHGCHTMIRTRKKYVSWKLFGFINVLALLMLLLSASLRLIQTAHSERGRFVEGSQIYTAWIIGCYRGKKRKIEAPPVPPPSPEIMR